MRDCLILILYIFLRRTNKYRKIAAHNVNMIKLRLYKFSTVEKSNFDKWTFAFVSVI